MCKNRKMLVLVLLAAILTVTACNVSMVKGSRNLIRDEASQQF